MPKTIASLQLFASLPANPVTKCGGVRSQKENRCPVVTDVGPAMIQYHTIKCGAQQSLNAHRVAILSGDQLRWGYHLLASSAIHLYTQALSSHLESSQDPEADSSILALQKIATTDQSLMFLEPVVFIHEAG
uniref:Uncharacterized protein n=1 Tax=Micrurus carvalhoi TaxID=3147026 RepID=A0A2H6N747_9SAUR